MAFEKFTHLNLSRAKITLRENGQIGFSQGAIDMFNVDKYKFCALYYDRETKKIGLKFTNDFEESSTAKVTIRHQNRYLNSRPFLDFYGISYTPSRSFIALEDHESGFIVVDLNKSLPSKKGKRKEE